MNEILNAAAAHVVRYLLVGTVAALVLVLLAWVILKAVRVRTSVYRHMIWLYALIGCLVLPLIWLYGPKMTLAILPTWADASAHAISSQSGSYVDATASQFPMMPTNLGKQSATVVKPQPFLWRTAVASVWLAGFAFMLTRLAVGWRRLRRICLSATPAPQTQCHAALYGQTPTVRLTSQLPGPVCFGVLRPIILLPQDLYDTGTAENLRMVLTHEMAHIERHDAWVNLFQRIVESMYFFHPFVWWASRQLTQQRQQICDNHVLVDGASPDDYTTLLSHIGERTMHARYLQALAFSEGQLLARIRALLDPSRNHQTKLPWQVAAVCTAAVLAGFLVFGSVRLAAQPSDRATGTSPGSPGSSSTTTEQKPVQSSTVAAADSERPEQPRFAARTFNAQTILDVFVREDPGMDQRKEVGRTPSAAPLGIPACWLWWVRPSGPVKDWDLLVREMRENKVPGLALVSATDSDLKRLADLAGLLSLDLKNSGQLTDTGVAHLASLTRLQLLDLEGTKITGAGLEHLRGLSELQYLRLKNARVTDAGIEHLKGLSGLSVLNLANTTITDVGLEHLKGLTGLQTLDVSGTRVTDAGMVHVKGLTRLQEFSANDTPITDAGLVHLQGLAGLEGVELADTQVTDAGLEHLKGLTRLQLLWFSGNKITDAGLEHIKGLARLGWLGLNGTQITGAGLAHISGLTGLHMLSLNGSPITDAGLQHLRGLTELETLTLNGTRIMGTGLAHLDNMTRLYQLHLADTELTDAGLKHLKGLTGLRFLILSGTQITDAGLEHLKGLTTLQILNLNGTKIGDAGLAHLQGLTGLQVLYLDGTQVTDTGIQQLKQSVPKLWISKRNHGE